MNLPGPALVAVGALAGAVCVGLALWLAAWRRPPEVHLTITRNALPPREPQPPLDRSDPVAVRPGEPGRTLPSSVALRIASGADPVLNRLLALPGPEAMPEVGRVGSPALALASARAGFSMGRTGDATVRPAWGDAADGPVPAQATADPQPDRAPDRAQPDRAPTSLPSEPVTDVPVPVQATSNPIPEPALDGPAPDRGDASPADVDPTADGPCAAERRLLRELTAVIERARAAYDEAIETQRRTQREYDASVARLESATRAMDGRRILEEKDAAQRRFRTERLAARDATAVEEAAGRWLATVNQLNVRVRDAQRVAGVERRRVTRMVSELEACAARADATRISLESVEQRRQQAREALAACEELQVARLQAARMAATAPPAEHPAAAAPAAAEAARDAQTAPIPEDVDSDLELLERVPTAPATVLAGIVSGDDALLEDVVAELAAGSDDESRRWRLGLSALRDAIVAAAIEAAAIDLPADQPFWSEFTATEAREIAEALASLGYRFDGRAGFADDRVPSTRDLALSVGYAGLDPRRIRRWPSATEIPLLFRGARVAAAEFVTMGAPDLSLGEMVGMLGRRAPDLTSLWDEWGRARPVLARTRR